MPSCHERHAPQLWHAQISPVLTKISVAIFSDLAVAQLHGLNLYRPENRLFHVRGGRLRGQTGFRRTGLSEKNHTLSQFLIPLSGASDYNVSLVKGGGGFLQRRLIDH